MPQDKLTSEEAAELLGISKATLYSYVSRGVIRSLPAEAGTRRRYYKRSEVVALKHRHSYRNDPERAAREVIEFGNPILTTSISQITATDHSYRGMSSHELAETSTFEQVAQFLWTGERAGSKLVEARPEWKTTTDANVPNWLPQELTPLERMQCLLPALEHEDLSSYSAKPAVLIPSAIRILKYLTLLSGGLASKGIAASLADAWEADASTLDSLLIMVADHELNIATFTARCAASAGSNLYQAVLAGLTALQGHKHLHGQVAAARDFFDEVIEAGDPEPVLRRYLRIGGNVPGFHNPYRRLYVDRDPRVGVILELLSVGKNAELLHKTVELAESATGEHTRIDFALGCVEATLGLPRDATFSLIAIGRTAGMIAHILEQYTSERVIRPRAQYIGSASL